MLSDSATALRLILAHEGGKVDDPDDPGGRTNLGITQRVYDGWRKSKRLPVRDVWRIEMSEAHAIYTAQYLDAVKFSKLPAGLNYAVADYAVNSGPWQAIMDLQRELNTLIDKPIAVDGGIGALTLAAVGEVERDGEIDLLIERYCERRLRFMQSLKRWWKYGNGWTRRVMGKRSGAQPGKDTGVIDYALAMRNAVELADPVAIGAFEGESEGGKALPSDIAATKTAEGAGIATAGATGALVVIGQVIKELQPLADAPILGESVQVILAVLGLTSAGLLVYSAVRSLAAKKAAA